MCERCEINPYRTGEKEIPEEPVEVVHDYLVLYPDLMQFGKDYIVQYKGKTYMIAKTDLGVVSISSIDETEKETVPENIKEKYFVIEKKKLKDAIVSGQLSVSAIIRKIEDLLREITKNHVSLKQHFVTEVLSQK